MKPLQAIRWGTAVLVGLITNPLLAAELVVYKSPTCDCCTGWIEHMQQNGFTVAVKVQEDMDKIKSQLGVPADLASCHTGQIGGYLVEGHVPAADVRRLLAEKPPVKGIAAPGMPVGSPGMEIPGQKPDPYQVVTFTSDGQVKVFSSH